MLDSKQKGSWYRKINALVLTFNALRLLFLCFSSKTVCCPRELTAWGQFFGFSGRGHCGCPRPPVLYTLFVYRRLGFQRTFSSVSALGWGDEWGSFILHGLGCSQWSHIKQEENSQPHMKGSHNARSYISQSFSTSSEDPPNSCCVDEWLFPGCLQIGLGDGIETSSPFVSSRCFEGVFL